MSNLKPESLIQATYILIYLSHNTFLTRRTCARIINTYCFKMISFEVTCYMAIDNQSLVVTLTSINFRMFSWSANLEGPSSPRHEIETLIVAGYEHERKTDLA